MCHFFPLEDKSGILLTWDVCASSLFFPKIQVTGIILHFLHFGVDNVMLDYPLTQTRIIYVNVCICFPADFYRGDGTKDCAAPCYDRYLQEQTVTSPPHWGLRNSFQSPVCLNTHS